MIFLGKIYRCRCCPFLIYNKALPWYALFLDCSRKHHTPLKEMDKNIYHITMKSSKSRIDVTFQKAHWIVLHYLFYARVKSMSSHLAMVAWSVEHLLHKKFHLPTVVRIPLGTQIWYSAHYYY